MRTDAKGDGNLEIRRNWDWLREGSIRLDDYDNTLHHFWYAEEGLHEDPNDDYDVYNAWETVQPWWILALNFWNAGDLGVAYKYLGYAMHLMQDMGQPAHANEDMHPGDTAQNDDSLEDWMTEDWVRDVFIWNPWNLHSFPGPIIYPIPSNDGIVMDMVNASAWVGSGEVIAEPLLTDTSLTRTYNMPKVFYYMYYVNQIGNYFASDAEEGNANSIDLIGWLGGFPDFPTQLWDADAEGPDKWVSIHNQDGLEGLADNDGCDCDDDGDLSTIMRWAYRASFRATPGFIDLFRRTVDNVPPVTTVELSQEDLDEVRLAPEWNNSPVTVKLVDATDYPNEGYRAPWNESFRPSGVWKIWGKCDGTPPDDPDDPIPYWAISTEGKHKVECMSTDWCGNVEQDQDIEIWIDMTPPEVTFPDLRPNYLTSETFTATWLATDELSGVASEVAYLDGTLVSKGQVFDLALLAGLHTLQVIAYDNAGNFRDVTYNFEVWIDADGWCFSILINNKTKGSAMSCVVEFPEPYDISMVDLITSTLSVKGTLDLTQNDPIIGETAVLPTQLLTGVGDHDLDLIPDRMLQFNKELFVAALAGETGDIGSIISGGLLPSGQPRFIVEVTVPVFKSTKK